MIEMLIFNRNLLSMFIFQLCIHILMKLLIEEGNLKKITIEVDRSGLKSSCVYHELTHNHIIIYQLR